MILPIEIRTATAYANAVLGKMAARYKINGKMRDVRIPAGPYI